MKKPLPASVFRPFRYILLNSESIHHYMHLLVDLYITTFTYQIPITNDLRTSTFKIDPRTHRSRSNSHTPDIPPHQDPKRARERHGIHHLLITLTLLAYPVAYALTRASTVHAGWEVRVANTKILQLGKGEDVTYLDTQDPRQAAALGVTDEALKYRNQKPRSLEVTVTYKLELDPKIRVPHEAHIR